MTNSAETISHQELGEQQQKSQEKKPAYLTNFGEFKTTIRMGDVPRSFVVRPINSADISKFRGAIATEISKKEEMITNEFALQTPQSDAEVLERGRLAQQTNESTTQSLQGEKEIMNNFLEEIDLILNGQQPNIYVFEDETAQAVLNLYMSEVKGTELNSAPDMQDITNQGAQYCFVLTPSKGEEMAEIFRKYDHRVDELKSGRGFNAEVGGVRMLFIYSEVQANELEENDLEESPSINAGDKEDEEDDTNKENNKV